MSEGTPRRIWTVVSLLAAAAVALNGCQRDEPVHAEGIEEAHQEEKHDAHDENVVELSAEAVARAGIATSPAELRLLPSSLATSGRIGYDERRLAHVSPRLAGRVQKVAAELGDAVAAGQVMAWIDSIELGQAKAAYLRARARLEVARHRHEREQELYAARITAENVALEAEAAAREVAADLAAAEESLHLFGLDHEDVAGLSYDDPKASLYALRAPFAGKVVAKEVALGELVTPERTLFTVADLSRVWGWIDIYEQSLRHVEEGQEARISVDAFPGEVFQGRVSYLGDEVAPESRTLRGRVDLENPDGRLRPGMFARVELSDPVAEDAPPALVVPRAAVQGLREETVVFVALEGDEGTRRFERRPVRLGHQSAGWVEVLAGLEPGDEVVTEGAFLLKSAASEDELGGGHHH